MTAAWESATVWIHQGVDMLMSVRHVPKSETSIEFDLQLTQSQPCVKADPGAAALSKSTRVTSLATISLHNQKNVTVSHVAFSKAHCSKQQVCMRE